MSIAQSSGSAPVEVIAEPSSNFSEPVTKWDLTPKMMPFLDRHLIFPLLEFLSLREMYPASDLLRSKYELLKETNMTDYISSMWTELHDGEDVPDTLSQRRSEVLSKLKELERDSQTVLSVLENPDVISALRQDKSQNLNYLRENHGVTSAMVNTLYEYGQFQYNCGNYGGAADLLYHFRILSTEVDMNTSATWGKFACEILTVNWDGSLEELGKIRDFIDQKAYSNPLSQLHMRSWLIHWSLFPFFNLEAGRDVLCDLFFTPAYINTIQTSCPWIIRYLSAAVVTNRTKGRNNANFQKQLRELVRVLKQEEYEYSDPVSEFLLALYVKFDFEEAQQKLAEAKILLKNDFFLVSTAEEFVDSARHLISEAYCHIHQRIDIYDLSKRLNLTKPEGEKWIVNLIRETRVDAKIDFTTVCKVFTEANMKGTVIMNHPPQSVYQQVIEKTKSLSFRSQVLSQTLA